MLHAETCGYPLPIRGGYGEECIKLSHSVMLSALTHALSRIPPGHIFITYITQVQRLGGGAQAAKAGGAVSQGGATTGSG